MRAAIRPDLRSAVAPAKKGSLLLLRESLAKIPSHHIVVLTPALMVAWKLDWPCDPRGSALAMGAKLTIGQSLKPK